MQNLEQIRAKQALSDGEGLDKTAVSKLPALVLNNGLLATTAFCLSGGGDNRAGMKTTMERVARHLIQRGLVTVSATGGDVLKGFIEGLAQGSSVRLQHATAEAMAYLGYLKRFAKDSKNSKGT